GVLIGGRALGVDGGIDQAAAPLLKRLLKALAEDKGVELGVGGNLSRREEHGIKLLRGKIIAVLELLVPHGDGEGEHLNAQFLPQGAGDVGGGVCDKFDRYHGGPPKIVHYLGITPIIADPERIVNEREIKNLPPNIKILPGDRSRKER